MYQEAEGVPPGVPLAFADQKLQLSPMQYCWGKLKDRSGKPQ